MREIYPKLQSKDDVESLRAMSSTILIKNWDLPPRNASKKKSKMKSNNSSPSDQNNTALDSEKKKQRNRDAQRAFRERNANRVTQLEQTVESLQNLVLKWQTMFHNIDSELKNSKSMLESTLKENIRCKDKIKELELALKESPATKDNYSLNEIDFSEIYAIKKANKPKKGRIQKKDIPITQLNLKSLLSEIKPMKAVPLPTSKILKQDNNTSNMADEYIQPKTIQFDSATVSCGFCTDSSTCVCREFEKDTIQTNDVIEPCVGEKCSSNPETCTKCDDIEATCIRPIDKET
ncbi:hypothetical protein TBLA_0A04860 [Henningerozyma blattae CBS 6284]|uniref:BZIP domain-containing protein n=1 Tax=Henningerozyma blattae (strain ATCC 34711 / CBS 6284 / DSM 70876 / NBRC 10599 / NRRL Y-10934 / UCD 77-7) TaxID=1071380 RepID=I2GVX7_HENB6|nr:hypothetical protein TBLA_0A04860 [Tetrapisispora blattae CBS 6284]CCH58279.1 hypothetical protein TBLA_0A04860 [Tetrapisispora blattae CBS 6284]